MSVKGKVEALIRDKASTTTLCLFLMYLAMDDVETTNRLYRFFALVVLAGWIFYQGNKHKEIMLHEKGRDLKKEIEDWVYSMWRMMGERNGTDRRHEGDSADSPETRTSGSGDGSDGVLRSGGSEEAERESTSRSSFSDLSEPPSAL